jgi:hypothetical protein
VLDPAAQLLQIGLAVPTAVVLTRRGPPPRRAPFAGLAVLLSLLSVLPAPVGPFLAGKEGATEALTVGVLLALAWRGRHESWIVAAAASLLLLEELSWLQPLLGFDTPALLVEAGTRSDDMNLHNLPGLDAAWRLGPLVGVLTIALLPHRPPLPDLDAGAAWGIAGTVLAVIGVLLVLPEEPVGEAFELACCLAVWWGWRARDG